MVLYFKIPFFLIINKNVLFYIFINNLMLFYGRIILLKKKRVFFMKNKMGLKIIIATVVATSTLTATLPAKAQTLFGYSASSGTKVKVSSWFSSGIKTTATHAAATKNLKKGKYVKQTAVRIKEGDYNSGWKYSKKPASKKSKGFYKKTIDKYNNPFKTAVTSNTFTYFK